MMLKSMLTQTTSREHLQPFSLAKVMIQKEEQEARFQKIRVKGVIHSLLKKTAKNRQKKRLKYL